ncbi:uncharacterized protein BJ171DRAFT_510503 [Polychytrium aggregatum]|uniref:uncharacterized protein n=1 Tax=Polychytrium aggregatum TaxID=110093 RepID=UPI0022FF349C|nr:uncharacterized protein BJ171DRAFT_510503 [Polychytrium aggregatum]KAI9203364.1 hypothetical protein BJ171DRAFT_510503 [Polychytrium aggregatum]
MLPAALALLAVSACLLPRADAVPDYSLDSVVRFNIQNESDATLLRSFLQSRHNDLHTALWSHSIGIGAVDVQLPVRAEPLSILSQIDNTVYIPNVQAVLQEDNLAPVPRIFAAATNASVPTASTWRNSSFFDNYQSYSDIIAYYESLPNLQKTSIGLSYLGTPIYAFSFGSGSRSIFYQGGIHAREWISHSTTAYITSSLVLDDGLAATLRSQFKFFVIPTLNVDGYNYTRTVDRMWRKNLEPNNGSSCIGTDLNRNFDTAWDQPGHGISPCDEDYSGPSAASATETQLLKTFISGLPNPFGLMDFHSYSQLWMYPYGAYCNRTIPEGPLLQNASIIATSIIANRSKTYYQYGPTCNTIYQASGTLLDYGYVSGNIKYSLTVELPDQGTYGFLLPPSFIRSVGEDTTQAFVAMWSYLNDPSSASVVSSPAAASHSRSTTFSSTVAHFMVALLAAALLSRRII